MISSGVIVGFNSSLVMSATNGSTIHVSDRMLHRNASPLVLSTCDVVSQALYGLSLDRSLQICDSSLTRVSKVCVISSDNFIIRSNNRIQLHFVNYFFVNMKASHCYAKNSMSARLITIQNLSIRLHSLTAKMSPILSSIFRFELQIDANEEALE